MAPLEFLETKLVNQLKHSMFITFAPAPPLEIPAGKEIPTFTATLEEIYIYDEDDEAENAYTLSSALSLGPGTVVKVIEHDGNPALIYRPKHGETDEWAPLWKTSGGHLLHEQVESTPLSRNTEIDIFLGCADEDASDAVTMLNAGAGASVTEPGDALDMFLAGLGPPKPLPKGLGGGGGGGGGGGTTQPPPISGPPPPAANVVIVSKAALDDPRFAPATLKGYRDMMDILSVFTFLSSWEVSKKSKQLGREISPTKDTGIWISTTADAYFKAPLHPLLGSSLIVTAPGGIKIDRTCKRGDVHSTFLNEFAQDFKVDNDAYQTLDKMLTEFTRSLNTKGEMGTQDIHFALARPYIPVQQIPGSKFSMVMPRLKIFYISAAAKTFNEIVKSGKSRSTVEKVNLRFEYITKICDLNEGLWDAQRPIAMAAVRHFTNKELDQLSGNIATSVIVP